MTAQTRATLKGNFEQGDQPQGTDYADLIDSFLSLSDSTAQTVTSDLTLSGGLTVGGVTSAASAVINSLNLVAYVTAMATASAVTGAGQTLPNQVAGYVTVTVCGQTVAFPYFKVV